MARARALAFLSAALLASCGPQEKPQRPSVLFVVWDTVRADHLSLYGHRRETTPALDRWAEGALVFEDCISTASSTVPSHAAMFTGLYPSEHGANNLFLQLDQAHETLAEIFQEAGYGTYLYSANPHLSSSENFTQGFEHEEHPWSQDNLEQALAIVRNKVEQAGLPDTSSELPAKIQSGQFQTWDLKASGSLAERGLLRWLDARPAGEPFFAFLNYMEAHRPYVPSLAARQAFMTPEEARASYGVDRSWDRMWSYTFGLEELSAKELDITQRTYDACLLELDQLFEHLLRSLESAGHLQDTIIVLVGDHGEHLGEQHMLDHQYSLYQGVLHVPLLLWNPKRIPAGRSGAPVSNIDLFPTLLELCELESIRGPKSQARSLLGSGPRRGRLSEYPSDFDFPIQSVSASHPEWRPGPWKRRLSAWQAEGHKFIWTSDGKHELYDLAQDPGELENRAVRDPERVQHMQQQLSQFLGLLEAYTYSGNAHPDLGSEQRERLQALGYFSAAEDE